MHAHRAIRFFLMRTERAMFKFHNFSLTAWLWLWLWIMFAAASARAQQALTWEQVRARFEQIGAGLPFTPQPVRTFSASAPAGRAPPFENPTSL